MNNPIQRWGLNLAISIVFYDGDYDPNPILRQVYGEWKFIEQQGWRVEIYSTVRLTIGNLWGNMIGLPNDGNVAIKVMCPNTLCVDGDDRKLTRPHVPCVTQNGSKELALRKWPETWCRSRLITLEGVEGLCWESRD
jgi:hypothetical protein